MTRSPAVLRPAAPADVPALRQLIGALAEYERLAHEVVATEADIAAALFGDTPFAHAILAETGGEAVGFALWFYSFSTFTGRPSLYVEDVFVAPVHRGGGIGRALFRHMARTALARGCARMEWSVLDWNAPSIAFYRSLGAVPKSGWTVQRLTGDALAVLAAEGGSNA